MARFVIETHTSVIKLFLTAKAFSEKLNQMKRNYLFLAICLCFNVGLFAQTSPYVSKVLEYKPAPGQFINSDPWGNSASPETLIGGASGTLSLGAFGGYVIVGFDHSIENDPNNPYGVDFSIIGNAFDGWAEPGIVYVMKDENGNGLADDTWYQLKGSDYSKANTLPNYSLTYVNPGGYADVPWRDVLNKRGAVLVNAYHKQPYYPSSDAFPNVNPSRESYSGTLISGNVDDSNPSYIQSFALDYGYADNHPAEKDGDYVHLPDNPSTVGTLEGAGGDAMKIEWAIDAEGNSVSLDEIDFVKIQTGLNRMCGWLGEVSTEIRGVVDVAPASGAKKKAKAKKVELRRVSVYPSSAQGITGKFELFNVEGNSALKVSSLRDKRLNQLDKGAYIVKNADNKSICKVIIE